MSNSPKDIRKQVRNVTQELLPDLLKTEVFKGLHESLTKHIDGRLNQLAEEVRQTLISMEDRQKNVQQFIMNQVQSEIAKSTPSPATIPNTEATTELTVE
jgi:hypothetical protein